MESKNRENIIDSTGCLSMEILTAYHENTLPNDEAHKVEQHLTDCEMCSDALEMIQEHGADKINEIGNKVASKVEEQIAPPAKFNWLKVAVVVALIITVGDYYLNNGKEEFANDMVQETPIENSIPEPVDEVEPNLVPEEIAPIRIIDRVEEGLIIQVATIDSNDRIEYYDSSNIDVALDVPIELVVVNTVEEVVADSVEEYKSITGSTELDVDTRKRRTHRKDGHAFGSESDRDEVAEFPGGDKELKAYLTEVAKSMTKLNGEVTVVFDLDKKGNIIKSKIKKSSNKDLNDFAIKIVDDMPTWLPATRNGKAIGSRQKLLLIF